MNRFPWRFATLTASSFLILFAASDGARGEESPIPVIAVEAKTVEGIARDFSLTGTITAKRRSRLSSRTTGLVEKMGVDAGSIVNKGDVLMALDTRLAEIAMEQIDAEIEQAEVELADAKRRVEEVTGLAKTGGFAKSEAETLQAAEQIAEASLKQLQVRKREQAELIERHKLVAPFSGIISDKISEEGEWVQTGTPVLELVEMDNLRFDIQVPQEFLEQVRDAESVRVVLDSYPERTFEAKIDVLVPVKDSVSRTFLTRLTLMEGASLAAPGMSGKAVISTRPKDKSSVQIPRDAVVRYPDGTAKVWVVQGAGENSKVSSREVKTAGALGESVEVVDGLEGGESIVLMGNEGLREDQAVEVRESASSKGQP
ncbi:MAG: hypothetical protein CMO55_26435 [Verrucomicrobiales bacterium]|nr:hypothetical protein [Verrucomicrobiales bacterium]